jgi:uncharacterized protein YndB with AHSA1/START domain
VNDTTTATPQTLVIRRTLNAPRQRVFDACSQPELLQRWLGPPGYTIPAITFDLRVGAAYRFDMKSPDGEISTVAGEIREFRAPERLSYTWRWLEDSPEDEHDTLLTIELHERGAATELVLTHTNFVDAASRDRHEAGWSSVLDKLPSLL